MSFAVAAGIAFVAGLLLSSLFFGVLWWVFRKTMSLVKMVVGWAITMLVLGLGALVVYVVVAGG